MVHVDWWSRKISSDPNSIQSTVLEKNIEGQATFRATFISFY